MLLVVFTCSVDKQEGLKKKREGKQRYATKKNTILLVIQNGFDT